jgi:hypothetical protein
VQIVKVMGGLGNQMFAYAFAMALRGLGRQVALDVTWHDRHVAHNGWELDRVFELDIPLASESERDGLADLGDGFGSRLRRKLFGPRNGHVVERGNGYDPCYLELTGDAYFDGYWQSPLYHGGIEAAVERAFRFPADLEPGAVACLRASDGRIRIGVHVRRGDYTESEELGGVCGEAYHRRAISLLRQGAPDAALLFFSDDLDWCRERLGGGSDAFYVDWNRGSDSWRDMRLMTLCDRLSISNSSFGWWGARLGQRGRAIVAPDRWFGGRHPDNAHIAPSGGPV